MWVAAGMQFTGGRGVCATGIDKVRPLLAPHYDSVPAFGGGGPNLGGQVPALGDARRAQRPGGGISRARSDPDAVSRPRVLAIPRHWSARK
jgi:hypothetical protein